MSKIEQLKHKYMQSKSLKDARAYAYALARDSANQALDGRKETVKALRELSEDYEDKEIALAYAKALVNLSAEQDVAGRKETVETLGKLSADYKDKEIALLYAKGLVNLSVKQDEDGIKETVETLRELAGEYKDKDIALEYAQALVNLSFEQDEDGIKETVETLGKLSADYKDKDITLVYVNALFNLSFEQDEDGIKATVETLRELSENYKDKAFALEYAQALVILSFEQDVDGIKATVEMLRKLLGDYEDKEFAYIYAITLVNYVKHIDESQLNEVYGLIDEVVTLQKEYYSDSQEDVFVYFVNAILSHDKIVLESSYIDKLFKLGFTLKNYDRTLLPDEAEGKQRILKIYIATLKIMSELQLKKASTVELSHYGKIDSLSKLIFYKPQAKKDVKGDVKLRLSNASYMNDPNEGVTLFEYLCITESAKDLPPTNLTQGVSEVYLFSLSKRRDNLDMWSRYGDDGKGCMYVFDAKFFDQPQNFTDYNITYKQLSNENQDGDDLVDNQENNNFRHSIVPYNICYINSKNELLLYDAEDSATKKRLKEIKISLNIIKKEMSDLDGKSSKLSQHILEQIRYLFKSSDYEHEQEVRLLMHVPMTAHNKQTVIKMDDSKLPVPYLYVEIDDRPLKLNEVVLGPKVENPDFIAPYIAFCDHSVVVSQSKISYR